MISYKNSTPEQIRAWKENRDAEVYGNEWKEKSKHVANGGSPFDYISNADVATRLKGEFR